MKVVEQVFRMIREKKLKPGDQLPSERTIAEQMGISRPTVREAVAALEVVGLVETRIGQGTFIKSVELEPLRFRAESLFLEERSPFEALETRKVLESYAAALAAERATDEQLGEIAAALAEIEDGVKNDSMWNEAADRRFHLAVLAATNNSVLYDVTKMLLEMNQHRVWFKLKEMGRLLPGSLEKDLSEHQAIYNAILSRNQEKAKEVVWNHYVMVERDIFGA